MGKYTIQDGSIIVNKVYDVIENAVYDVVRKIDKGYKTEIIYPEQGILTNTKEKGVKFLKISAVSNIDEDYGGTALAEISLTRHKKDNMWMINVCFSDKSEEDEPIIYNFSLGETKDNRSFSFFLAEEEVTEDDLVGVYKEMYEEIEKAIFDFMKDVNDGVDGLPDSE